MAHCEARVWDGSTADFKQSSCGCQSKFSVVDQTNGVEVVRKVCQTHYSKHYESTLNGGIFGCRFSESKEGMFCGFMDEPINQKMFRIKESERAKFQLGYVWNTKGWKHTVLQILPNNIIKVSFSK